MYYYASGLLKLDLSWSTGYFRFLTSVGNNFMHYYARIALNLESLGVPDTSGLTSVGTSCPTMPMVVIPSLS